MEKKYHYIIAYKCWIEAGWGKSEQERMDSITISCDHKLNTFTGMAEVEKMIHNSEWNNHYKDNWIDPINNHCFEENLAVKILSISELEVEEEKINLTSVKNHDK